MAPFDCPVLAGSNPPLECFTLVGSPQFNNHGGNCQLRGITVVNAIDGLLPVTFIASTRSLFVTGRA